MLPTPLLEGLGTPSGPTNTAKKGWTMKKKSFFGLTKPRFEYAPPSAPMTPETLPVPKRATFYVPRPFNRKDTLRVKPGDPVKTGEKLVVFEDATAYVTSSVTGTVASVAPYIGDFGETATAVTVDVADEEAFDGAFAEAAPEPSLEAMVDYLKGLPGSPDLDRFSDPDHPVKVVAVRGCDTDLMVVTQQHVLGSRAKRIGRGISILKSLAHVGSVVVTVPAHLTHVVGGIGGRSGEEIRVIGDEYPAALRPFLLQTVLGEPLPAGKTEADAGVLVLSAEAVAGIGEAFDTGRVPITKTVTLIRKDLSRVLVEARVGTPIRDIFAACDVTVNEMDRIIVGGPMTGATIYSEDYPVRPDTDAVMVQDCTEISLTQNTPCINCGECVRVCPANVPVNMLVRFCEARQYETAADEYDLYSCIECGLCSFVCVSRIPIFQYIKLAKYELGRIEEEAAEEADG